MNQEEIFVKELSALVRLGKNQGNQLSFAQIKEAFTQSEISDEKMPFIYEYLQKNQLRIDEEFDPDEVMGSEDRDFLGMFMEDFHYILNLIVKLILFLVGYLVISKYFNSFSYSYYQEKVKSFSRKR